MDDNAIHEWLIKCFGSIQGEMAWQQISALPAEIREQLMAQDPAHLPDPEQVQQMMAAFSVSGLNTMDDMQRTVEEGPINVKLAKSIALSGTKGDADVNAVQAEAARRAMSEANLWLDTASAFDPAPGEPAVLTRAAWVEDTIDQWATFAAPVAEAVNEALASVISERLGGALGEGEIAGVFAGPVPIPIPEGMKDPAQLIKLLGNTSFAMQLGQAAGNLSHEVHGSFDQGIALLKNPAGGLIAQNVSEYADMLNGRMPVDDDADTNKADVNPIGFTSAHAESVSPTTSDADTTNSHPTAEDAQFEAAWLGASQTDDIPESEVLAFLALREMAHARLFSSVTWLMPRFESLIGKYARGISIDLDAMEEQLRDAGGMDPESISGAVNMAKVGIPDTPEQHEALVSLESLLAMVEGWVDCVVWRAGMPHIAHIEQLREMMRREQALGGPAARTFENLLGLRLRPKRMREAAGLWDMITTAEGVQKRDAKWSHPDLLPVLASSETAAANPTQAENGNTIDWDSELSKLLDGDDTNSASDPSDDPSDGPTA